MKQTKGKGQHLQKAVFGAKQEQLAKQQRAFSPVLRVQVLCSAFLLGVVLCCQFFCPTCFGAWQARYQTWFESSDYAPTLLRFAQQAVEALAMPAQATDAPEGSSLQAYVPSEVWVCPTSPYVISSGYGWRESPFGNGWSFHAGVDLACAEGQAVQAVQAGVVERNYLSESYGNCILLRHPDGSVTLYAHLQYAFARVGERIGAGQQIGTVGQTGAATGAHLHFEVRVNNEKQDPSTALGL